MSGGSWEAVSGQTNIPGNDGIDTLTDPSPPAGRSFYRVAVAIP